MHRCVRDDALDIFSVRSFTVQISDRGVATGQNSKIIVGQNDALLCRCVSDHCAIFSNNVIRCRVCCEILHTVLFHCSLTSSQNHSTSCCKSQSCATWRLHKTASHYCVWKIIILDRMTFEPPALMELRTVNIYMMKEVGWWDGCVESVQKVDWFIATNDEPHYNSVIQS